MAVATTTERNKGIVEEYQDGREVAELAREYGVSARRIQQILKMNGVPIRQVRLADADRLPISRVHERIGTKLTDYMWDNELQHNDVANKLGWNIMKLRRVQSGIMDLELLDLIDLASLVATSIDDLISQRPQAVVDEQRTTSRLENKKRNTTYGGRPKKEKTYCE